MESISSCERVSWASTASVCIGGAATLVALTVLGRLKPLTGYLSTMGATLLSVPFIAFACRSAKKREPIGSEIVNTPIDRSEVAAPRAASPPPAPEADTKPVLKEEVSSELSEWQTILSKELSRVNYYALSFACAEGDFQKALALVNAPDTDYNLLTTDDGFTALHFALSHDNRTLNETDVTLRRSVILKLIEMEPKLKDAKRAGSYPIELAVCQLDVELLDALDTKLVHSGLLQIHANMGWTTSRLFLTERTCKRDAIQKLGWTTFHHLSNLWSPARGELERRKALVIDWINKRGTQTA